MIVGSNGTDTRVTRTSGWGHCVRMLSSLGGCKISERAVLAVLRVLRFAGGRRSVGVAIVATASYLAASV